MMVRSLKFPRFRQKFVDKCCRPYSTATKGDQSGTPGYIVLLPEYPDGALITSDTNEVLDTTKVPSTFQIDRQKFRDAIGFLSLKFESQVWNVEHLLKDRDYSVQENLMKDLDSLEIDYATGLLNIVHITENLSNYNSLTQRITSAVNLKYQSKPIYYLAKELLADNPRDSQLKKHVLMGKLNGLELTPEAQASLQKSHKELTKSKAQFSENVTKANKAFRHLVVDEKHLGNMSIREMAAIAKDRTNPKRGPWTVTLGKQVSTSFLENCPVPALRWNVWQAYTRRCTEDFTKNNNIVEDIRKHRHRIANVLGYRTHTELALESKMAENSQNVKSMIATLLLKCMPQQKMDLERLHKFSALNGYDTKLNQWDIPYWKKKENEQLFGVQDLTFPYRQTFQSLLSFTSRLFGFEYKEVSENHFVVKRSGEEIGRFVVDPYKTKSKFPGSYVLRNHLFSTLILNFEPPLYDNDSMLTLADVTSLIENFGHLLQNCITPISETIIEDFKVPGHFLGMWMGNQQFVENFLGLKEEKLTNYLKSRNHFVATELCHELYLADLDLELDLDEEHWLQLISQKLWKTYNVVDLDKDMSLCSSNLIYYGSTYYSELWSKMLAADCYRAFVESKEPNDVAVDGARFRKCFFEAPVGSQASEIFRSFRGRDPSPDAFLWSMGLIKLDKLDKNEEPMK